MPISILMPALSPTMTEGSLVKWVKKEGDSIKSGDVLAEIETDKATMEVESADEGILARILVPEGTESVKVNQLIALILEEGEDPASLDAVVQGGAPLAPAPAAPAAAPMAAPSAATPPSPTPPAPAMTSSAASGSSERILASPLARRLAKEQGLDLATIPGSGPRGRVVKADIEKAPASKASPESVATSSYTDIKLTGMRKVIASRLTASKQQVPHFYLTVDCEIDALLKTRAELNKHLEEQEVPLRISVNDLVVKALGLALKKVPEANCSWMDTFVRQFHSADIAVAVSVEGGLVTPVVRHVDKKSVVDLARELKELIDQARKGKLLPEAYAGGTCTVSNLGMYGIKDFQAILNPPQACILAVGAGEKRPVVRGDEIVPATLMTCTLSVDHRAVDGAAGAELIRAFKGYIESPIALVMG